MNPVERLLRARFNPCPERVEAIGKYLDGVLDAGAEGELSSHLEGCRRCRGYHLFLEAADRGFREEKARSVVPSLAAKLPVRLQEEMVEALKRNLSRWLTDAGRALMYRGGLISPLLFDGYDGKPFEVALDRSRALVRAFRSFNALSGGDGALLAGVELLLKGTEDGNGGDTLRDPSSFFIIARDFDRYNYYSYSYQAEVYARNDRYDSAAIILQEGTRLTLPFMVKGKFLNNIGRIHLLKGQGNAARAFFEKAREIDRKKENPIPDLNIGLCRLREEDPKGALDYFNRSLDICESLSSEYEKENYRRFVQHLIGLFIQRHIVIARNNKVLMDMRQRFDINLL